MLEDALHQAFALSQAQVNFQLKFSPTLHSEAMDITWYRISGNPISSH